MHTNSPFLACTPPFAQWKLEHHWILLPDFFLDVSGTHTQPSLSQHRIDTDSALSRLTPQDQDERPICRYLRWRLPHRRPHRSHPPLGTRVRPLHHPPCASPALRRQPHPQGAEPRHSLRRGRHQDCDCYRHWICQRGAAESRSCAAKGRIRTRAPRASLLRKVAPRSRRRGAPALVLPS